MDGFKRDDLSKMPMIGSDLLESSQLKVSFTDSYLEQRRAYSDPKRGLRNVIQLIRWRRTKTIGSGGFGITYIQEDDRGERRAVKETPKSLGRKEIIKVWREIMAMASFTKVRTYESPCESAGIRVESHRPLILTTGRSSFCEVRWVVSKRYAFTYCHGVC